MSSAFPQCLSFTRTTTMVPSSSRTARKRALSDSHVVHESDRKTAKKIRTDNQRPMPTMSSNMMSIAGPPQHPQNMSASQMPQCT